MRVGALGKKSGFPSSICKMLVRYIPKEKNIDIPHGSNKQRFADAQVNKGFLPKKGTQGGLIDLSFS